MVGTVPAGILDKLAKNEAADSASAWRGARGPEGHVRICRDAHGGVLEAATAEAAPRSSSRGPRVSSPRAAGEEGQRLREVPTRKLVLRP